MLLQARYNLAITSGESITYAEPKNTNNQLINPIKQKSPRLTAKAFVVPPGIEPGTHGFSVHCSTN